MATTGAYLLEAGTFDQTTGQQLQSLHYEYYVDVSNFLEISHRAYPDALCLTTALRTCSESTEWDMPQSTEWSAFLIVIVNGRVVFRSEDEISVGNIDKTFCLMGLVFGHFTPDFLLLSNEGRPVAICKPAPLISLQHRSDPTYLGDTSDDVLDPDETHYIKTNNLSIPIHMHNSSASCPDTQRCMPSSGVWKGMVWVPDPCLEPFQSDTALTHLAGQRVLIVGRSVSRGFFFSLLERLFGRILMSTENQKMSVQLASHGKLTASNWWRRAEEIAACPKGVSSHLTGNHGCKINCTSCSWTDENTGTTLMFWWAGPDFAYSPTFRTILDTDRPSILIVDSAYVDAVHDCHDQQYSSALNTLTKSLLTANEGIRSMFRSMLGTPPQTFLTLWAAKLGANDYGTDRPRPFMNVVQTVAAPWSFPILDFVTLALEGKALFEHDDVHPTFAYRTAQDILLRQLLVLSRNTDKPGAMK